MAKTAAEEKSPAEAPAEVSAEKPKTQKPQVVEVTVLSAGLGTCRVVWTDEGGNRNVDHLSYRGLVQTVDHFRDSDSALGQQRHAVAAMQLDAVADKLGIADAP